MSWCFRSLEEVRCYAYAYVDARPPEAQKMDDERRRERSPFPLPPHLASCLPHAHPTHLSSTKFLLLHIHGQGLLRIHVVVSGFFLPLISHLVYFSCWFRVFLFSCSVFSLRLCVFSFLYCCVRYHYLTTPRRPSPAPLAAVRLMASRFPPLLFYCIINWFSGLFFSLSLLRIRDTIRFDWVLLWLVFFFAVHPFLSSLRLFSMFTTHTHAHAHAPYMHAPTDTHTHLLTYA